ncbi:unnamed protein product [Phytophthora lilii]|uniref:Unnamed protein product n=1 Tax=Phytophthora lilii TaxID=2077276 RepID=A0A9W6T8X1_9STRA|nr:unnamed protein product [Phytophthora lilii]
MNHLFKSEQPSEERESMQQQPTRDEVQGASSADKNSFQHILNNLRVLPNDAVGKDGEVRFSVMRGHYPPRRAYNFGFRERNYCVNRVQPTGDVSSSPSFRIVAEKNSNCCASDTSAFRTAKPS